MANVFQQIGAVTAMNVRTIPQRLGISMVIVAGIAGVVGVLIAMLAMATGFERTLVWARKCGRPADRSSRRHRGAGTEV